MKPDHPKDSDIVVEHFTPHFQRFIAACQSDKIPAAYAQYVAIGIMSGFLAEQIGKSKMKELFDDIRTNVIEKIS